MIMDLPLRGQSLCVWLAAEPVVEIWINWCIRHDINDLSNTFIVCFWRWYSGDATDAEFESSAQEFALLLPEDIRELKDPAGCMAGVALHDVAMIALDKCEDMHYDILILAVEYAAAAATGNIKYSAISDPGPATAAEQSFFRVWWQRCQEQIPQLNEM